MTTLELLTIPGTDNSARIRRMRERSRKRVQSTLVRRKLALMVINSGKSRK